MILFAGAMSVIWSQTHIPLQRQTPETKHPGYGVVEGQEVSSRTSAPLATGWRPVGWMLHLASMWSATGAPPLPVGRTTWGVLCGAIARRSLIFLWKGIAPRLFPSGPFHLSCRLPLVPAIMRSKTPCPLLYVCVSYAEKYHLRLDISLPLGGGRVPACGWWGGGGTGCS